MQKLSKELYTHQLLTSLNERDRKIVELFFGLNENEKMTIREIAQTLRISDAYTDYIVEDFKDKLAIFEAKSKRVPNNFNKKDDYYQVEKVDEETQRLIDKMSDSFFKMFKADEMLVEKCLNSLPRMDKNIVFLYYGLDGIHCMDYDELAQKFRITVDRVDSIIEKSIIQIKRKLKEGVVSVSDRGVWRSNKYEELVSTYGKEKVEKALQNLEEDTQNMIKEYYLVKDSVPIHVIAKKFNISDSQAYLTVTNGIKYMQEIIENFSLKISKDDFYKKIGNYTKEEVDEVLNLIEEDKRKIVSRYYGINCERKNLKELSEEYNCSEEEILIIVNKTISKIKLRIENMRQVDKEVASFYNNFVGYSKEQVDLILDELNETEKNIISAHYGLRGIKLRKVEISAKYNVTYSIVNNVINGAIRKISQKLKIPSVDLVSSKYNKRTKKDKYELLVEKYGESKVLEALGKLDVKSRYVVENFYGLKGEKKKVEELASEFGVSSSYVYQNLRNSLKNIEGLIGNPQLSFIKEENESQIVSRNSNKKSRKELFYNKFEGFTEVQVNKAISRLDSKKREMITLYYGLDEEILSLEEMAQKYNKSKNSMSVYLSGVIKKIDDLLKNPSLDFKNKKEKEGDKYQLLIEKYGENKVLEALSRLDDKSKYLVEVFYGLKGEKKKVEEIANEFSFSFNYVYQILRKILKKIESLIENPQLSFIKEENESQIVSRNSNKKSRKELFYNKFEGYTEMQVNEAILKLNSRNREILKSYYGLEGPILNLQQISQKYNISKSSIYSNLGRIQKVVLNILKGQSPNYSMSKYKDLDFYMNRSEEFYNKFEGFDKDEIDLALSKLDSMGKEIVKLYYGLQGECLDTKQLCERYNKNSNAIYSCVYNSLKRIKNLLERSNDMNFKINKNRYNEKQFYDLFVGYTKEQVDNAIERLDKNSSYIVRCYYIEVPSLSQTQIAKELNMTQTAISRILKKATNNISYLLSNLEKDFSIVVEKEYKVSKKDKKQEFYSKFENYSEEKINEILLKLDNKQRVAIEGYYGLNGIYLTQKEISIKLGLSQTYVSRLIRSAMYAINLLLEGKEEVVKTTPFSSKIKIKKSKKEQFYAKFEGYSVEQVNDAINKLNQISKEMISLHYELDGEFLSIEEIAKRYNLTKNGASVKLSNIISKIKKILEDPEKAIVKMKVEKEKNNIKLDKKEMFYAKFDGYSEYEINEAITRLNKKHQDLIKLYYGLEGELLTIDQLCDRFCYTKNTVLNTISLQTKKIKSLLDNKELRYDVKRNRENGVVKSQKVVDREQEFYNRFYGYSKEEVDLAIEKLNVNRKKVIKDYYFSNVYKNVRELAQSYEKSYGSVNALINNAVRDILNNLKNPTLNKKSKENKYEKLIEIYGLSAVEEAFSKLNEREQKIIRLSYISSDEYSFTKIAEICGISGTYVHMILRSGLENLVKYIENPNFNLSIIKANDKKNKFYENFRDYSKEQIDEAIIRLSDKNRNIICDYYGLNGDILTQGQIAQKYKISSSNVGYNIKKALEKIELLLNDSTLDFSKDGVFGKKDKKAMFYEKFEGYNRQQVDEAILRLNVNDKEKIKLYYGLDGEYLSLDELAEKYGITKNSMRVYLTGIVKKIKTLLDNPQKDFSIVKSRNLIAKDKKIIFYDKFNGYGQESIDKAILRLSIRHQNIVKMYYGLENDPLSIVEIANVYNTSKANIYNTLTRIQEKLFKLLEYENLDFSKPKEKNKVEKVCIDKKEEFYRKFEGYSNDEIDAALAKLNSRNREMIELYYGLTGEKLLLKKIAEKYSLRTNYVSALLKREIEKIRILLSDPNYVFKGRSIGKKEEEKENKERKISKSITFINNPEFYKKFKEYYKTQIDRAVMNLNFGNREPLILYYGLEGEKLTLNELAEKYNTDVYSINSIISYGLLRIKELLSKEPKRVVNVVKQNRDEKFLALVNKYGREVVIKCIGQLNESEKAFLIMYYGIGTKKQYSLKEISEKINVEKNGFQILEEGILKKMVPMLRPTLIKIKQEEFKGLVKDNSKLMRIKEILTKGELNLLGSYYGLNGKDIMTTSEICDMLNISVDNLNKHIRQIIYKINNFNIGGR